MPAPVNTATANTINSTMLGSAILRSRVKNSASSHAVTATAIHIPSTPPDRNAKYPIAPRNMARPMVTKISLKPLMKRSCSSSGEAGNSGGSPAFSSARRRSACSAVMMPCSTPFVRISVAIIGADPLELGKPDQRSRKQSARSSLDDWRTRLPYRDRLEGMELDEDLHLRVVANVKQHPGFEHKAERNGRGNRQFPGREEPQHHVKCIGYRIDDGIAKIIQRDGAGAIALDGPGGIFQ